jgi:hypothetical protein
VRRPLGWLLGVFAVFGFLRRRRPAAAEPGDSRAEELRRKLVESRELVDERDEFEAAETPVDVAETIEDPDRRRRAVHEAGRTTAARMRGEGDH